MNMYDIIISFGIHNNCLDDILLCEELGNKTLCMIFDYEERMPQEHLIGRPRPSLVYIPLYKKKVETKEVLKKRSRFYPFYKEQEIEKVNEVETTESYEYFFKSNKSILLIYTELYEKVVIEMVKKYSQNIKRKMKRIKNNVV